MKGVNTHPKKHILALEVKLPFKIPVISDYSCQYPCLYTEICATFHWDRNSNAPWTVRSCGRLYPEGYRGEPG